MDHLPQPEIAAGPVHAKPCPRRSKRRIVFWTVLLLLAGWLLPALVRLNYIQGEVASALSANLGRPVRVGDVHPHLVSGWTSGMGLGLGVEVENVEIADDPRFGAEPLARIEVLEARLALRSIWHGRLEFSHVVLRNPSVNLVRGGGGDWNLLSLSLGGMNAAEAGTAAHSRLAQYPDVRVIDGRLNFKLDNRKKSVHLTGLNVILRAPRSGDQPWQFEFSGTPSRASFEQVPALVVRGEGQLGPFTSSAIQEAGVPLKFSWQARNALLGELAAVLAGTNHGMHGLVSLTGEASGTSTLLRVAGRASISDLHRWDVIPQAVSTEIPAEFSGILDLHGDFFQLTRFSLPLRVNQQQAGVIEVSGGVSRLSSFPALQLDAEARGVPLAALSVLSEPFAFHLDSSVGVTGSLDGRLNLHGLPHQWSGEVKLSDVVLSRGQQASGTEESSAGSTASRIRMASAVMRLQDGKFESDAMTAHFSAGGPMQIWASGSLLDHTRKVRLSAKNAPLSELLAWMPEQGADRLGIDSGRVDMDVTITQGGTGNPGYSGSAVITAAKWREAGWSVPIEITTARMQWKHRTATIRPLSGKFQGADVRGAVTLRLPDSVDGSVGGPQTSAAAAATSVSFDLQAAELNLDGLPAPAAPAKQSWFSVLLNRPRLEAGASAKTTSETTIAGKIKAGRLIFQGLEFAGLSANATWEDDRLSLGDVSAGLAGGRITGNLAVSLPGEGGVLAASLDVAANFRRLTVEQLADRIPEFAGQYAGQISGSIDLHGRAENWEEVWKSLAGKGEVTGINLTLARFQMPATTRAEIAPRPGVESLNELKPTRFTEATASFEVADQVITLTRLEGSPLAEGVEPPAGKLSKLFATGTVGFDRSLQIAMEQRPDGLRDRRTYRWTGSIASPQLEDAASLASNDASKPR